MGRFANLDFDARPPTPAPQEDPWPNLDADGCLRAGDADFHQGEYESALQHYSRSLRFSRDLPAAWLGQVRCLLALEEWEEAVTWSARALDRLPDHGDLLAARGLALVLAGDPKQGMEFLDGAVELRAPSSWVWLARGEALLAARQPETNARHCFLKALEQSPEDPDLQLRIGIAYRRRGLESVARAPLQAAVRLGGENPLALYHLGAVLAGAGEREAAAGHLRRALAARRAFPEAEAALERVSRAGPVAWVGNWWDRWARQREIGR